MEQRCFASTIGRRHEAAWFDVELNELEWQEAQIKEKIAELSENEIAKDYFSPRMNLSTSC